MRAKVASRGQRVTNAASDHTIRRRGHARARLPGSHPCRRTCPPPRPRRVAPAHLQRDPAAVHGARWTRARCGPPTALVPLAAPPPGPIQNQPLPPANRRSDMKITIYSRSIRRLHTHRFLAYTSPSRSPDPHHLAVLTRPDFAGAACHPPRHLPDQAAPSFTALLRQDSGEGLPPPLDQSAPHGARATDASGRRPASPGVPRLWHLPRRKVRDPADDLDPGSLLQPCGQAGCPSVRQQIHRPAGLDVDEHRAIDPSLRVAYSSTPTTRGAGNSGSGSTSSSRNTALRLMDTPSAWASRAPARPARARPTVARVDRNGPSTGCAAGSVPASAQRTSAEHTKTPDKRTAELVAGGSPAVPRSVRPQETAGKSCAPGSTRSHSPGMPPRPPYCRRRCVSPRDSRPTTAPTRPRWTVTAGPPGRRRLFHDASLSATRRSALVIFRQVTEGRSEREPSLSVRDSRKAGQNHYCSIKPTTRLS